jgi:DNA segregation ATPase FtsK/SpoIIIE-like protein
MPTTLNVPATKGEPMRTIASLFLALATALASLAQAQDFPNRVGRIAHIEGRASLYQDPEGGWELAYVNSPITSENSVWTDEGSRAEVRVSGMAIRLDHLTQLDVARLDEDELNAFIARGTVAVRVRHFENNERLVFSTPNARVRLRGNGRYRIDVDPDRLETRITVFEGEARVGTDDGRMSIPAGRSMLVFGASPPEFVDERVLTSAFDRWTLARDERWREGRAATYVSTNMTGYEDLDTYGTWATEPDYGTLWYPRNVSANWAPYRDGRWDYVRPWGWTWVDDAPWGYAPFHYGRWVYVRNRWAWHPGERVARPVWAPALVAFVGGSNFNFSISSGGTPVGWYPLSPWDRYDPWFQASPTYVNRVNVIVRNEPARQDRRDWQRWTRERGTTVVDRRTMLEQRSVRQAVLPVSAEVVRQVQAAPQPSAVLPTRNDVLQRRRQQPQQAPAPMVVAQPSAPVQPGAPAQARSERSAIARPDFGRNANAVVATPRRAAAPPPERAATSPVARDAQRQTQQEQQAQERAAREAQQAQQRQAREAQQQTQQQQQALERQTKERAQQQQQQQQAQERAAREAQQAQQRQARETQQQAQQQQQQQQQALERQNKERAQQQQQAQERAQREQQQAQARAQQQAQEQAKAQAAQQAQAQAAQQAQAQAAQAKAQAAEQAAKGKGRDDAPGRQREEEEEKEKGKGKNR